MAKTAEHKPTPQKDKVSRVGMVKVKDYPGPDGQVKGVGQVGEKTVVTNMKTTVEELDDKIVSS